MADDVELDQNGDDQRKQDMQLLKYLIDEALTRGHTLEMVRLDPNIRVVLLRVRRRARSMAAGERRFIHGIVKGLRNPDGTRKWKGVKISAQQLELPFFDNGFDRKYELLSDPSESHGSHGGSASSGGHENSGMLNVYAQPAGHIALNCVVPWTPQMKEAALINMFRHHIDEGNNAAWLTDEEKQWHAQSQVHLLSVLLRRAI